MTCERCSGKGWVTDRSDGQTYACIHCNNWQGLLTTADVAAMLGVTPATVSSYTARGVIPAPDGYLGRTPWWKRRTIEKWQASRPGQGKGGGRPRKQP